jgi:hypothetical protein
MEAISRRHTSPDRRFSVQPSDTANVNDDRPARPADAPQLISMLRSHRFCYREQPSTEHLNPM